MFILSGRGRGFDTMERREFNGNVLILRGGMRSILSATDLYIPTDHWLNIYELP